MFIVSLHSLSLFLSLSLSLSSSLSLSYLSQPMWNQYFSYSAFAVCSYNKGDCRELQTKSGKSGFTGWLCRHIWRIAKCITLRSFFSWVGSFRPLLLSFWVGLSGLVCVSASQCTCSFVQKIIASLKNWSQILIKIKWSISVLLSWNIKTVWQLGDAINIIVPRVRTRIFFSFATTFANLIFFVPISLNLGHFLPLFRKSH